MSNPENDDAGLMAGEGMMVGIGDPSLGGGNGLVGSMAQSELDEPIDYSLVYALHTFVANLEGQVCVLKGDALDLMDDSNSYWWLVKCIKTEEIGYIPAENIETPYERLARLNKIRNVQLALITLQDAQEADKPTLGERRGISFSQTNQVMSFEVDDEEEDGEYYEWEEAMEPVDEPNEMAAVGQAAPHAAQPAGKQKAGRVSVSLGGNFFKKILGRRKSGEKVGVEWDSANAANRPQLVAERRQDGGELEEPRIAQVSQTLTQQPIAPTQQLEPINVLRIYAGNVDLKATFKTVAINKNMTVGDLLEASLKRFRVPNASAGEYYLSVLHFDSQERPLPEGDNVLDDLDSLRRKNLPGISADRVSRAVNHSGKVSSVLMNDDNIIKVIINKKLNMFEKNYRLIRIFMYDEADQTNSVRTYKTIAVNEDLPVAEIVDMALKKFKLVPQPSSSYFLCTSIDGQERIREGHERIMPILEQENELGRMEFVLRKTQRGGPSASPDPNLVVAQSDLTTAKENPIAEKPSFLEELPLSPAAFRTGAVMSPTTFSDATEPSLSKFESPHSSVIYPISPAQNPAPPGMMPPFSGATSQTGDNHQHLYSQQGIVPAFPPQALQETLQHLEFRPGDLEKSGQSLMDEYLEEIMRPNIDNHRLEVLEILLRRLSPEEAILEAEDSDGGYPSSVSQQSRGSFAVRPVSFAGTSDLQPPLRKSSLGNKNLLGMLESMERDLDHLANSSGMMSIPSTVGPSSRGDMDGWSRNSQGFVTPTAGGIQHSKSAEFVLNSMQRVGV
ncbi:hypothetical protein DFJ73DRAFT_836598 [Zopfochytrium polystomum]|nr:hypothetical protein DFJ73DRAFT_836598 [Zopfochytrium polystomum]